MGNYLSSKLGLTGTFQINLNSGITPFVYSEVIFVRLATLQKRGIKEMEITL